MNIKNMYCTKNDCYKENKKLTKVAYLIVHSPGVYPSVIRAATGKNNWFRRWNKPGVEKLVHGFIDDTGVYKFAPHTMRCWHTGNTWGNSNCIGYELCEFCTVDEFNKMWDNAVNYYAELCKKYGLTSDCVIGHCEAYKKGIASNHADPEIYFKRFGKDMNDFRSDVKKILNGFSASESSGSSVSGIKKIDSKEGTLTIIYKGNDGVSVRKSANWVSLVVRTARYGDTLNVIAKYLVDGSYMYELSDGNYITGASAYVSFTEKYKEWVGMSTVNNLNVRTGPGTNYSKQKKWPKLHKGNLVDIIGEKKGADKYLWYKVRIAAKYIGYVRSDYIKKA